ncbi:hypothetical protein BH23GEM3_BH23GEM3_01870 [soil metagenome]
MPSIVAQFRADLEARGEYVVRANIISGWFAVFPKTWRERAEAAARAGRDAPNLIIYRTRSGELRDHHVIPYSVLRELLVEDTVTHSEANGSERWNLTLKDHLLHVSHRPERVDVSSYFGAPLLIEEVKHFIPEEVESASTYHEGAVRRIQVNAYERDRLARQKCIEHFGRRCIVCKMAFAEVYGPEVESLIHVHHLVPLSTVGQQYEVDPIRDLRPVCPNCHAVIHSRVPAYTIEEIRNMFTANSAGIGAFPQA